MMEPIDKRYVTISGKTGKLEKHDTRELASTFAQAHNRPDDAVYVLELKEIHCLPAVVKYP